MIKLRPGLDVLLKPFQRIPKKWNAGETQEPFILHESRIV
jgi:hypothetical protein